MERLTFEGDFCDIAQCAETRGGSFCEGGTCSQRKVWERLKAYEDTGLTPERCAELAAAAKHGRSIDVDVAVKKLRGECVAKFPGSFALGLYAAAAALEQMPTVEAARGTSGQELQRESGGHNE